MYWYTQLLVLHTCDLIITTDTNDIIVVQQLDPNAEVLHWLEVKHLKNTCYTQPFIVPSDLLPGYVNIVLALNGYY